MYVDYFKRFIGSSRVRVYNEFRTFMQIIVFELNVNFDVRKEMEQRFNLWETTLHFLMSPILINFKSAESELMKYCTYFTKTLRGTKLDYGILPGSSGATCDIQ